MILKRAKFEFTRSANTTTYGIDQVVSDGSKITFTFIDPNNTTPAAGGLKIGGSYMIKTAALCSNSSGTTNASFDLYLYSSGVTAATVDNSPFNLAYADKHVRIGKTSFTLLNPSANSNSKEDTNVDLNLAFRAVDTTIYGVLVATAAYTPASSEKFYGKIEILAIND